MSFKDVWKKLNSFSLANKFFPDYVINKNIFRFALIVSFLFLIAILSNYGFDFGTKFYVSCPVDNPTPCANPFYNYGNIGFPPCPDVALCKIPYFNQGDIYGSKPPLILKLFLYIILLLFGIAFLVNHVKYNRRVKK
ncbi:MAG: hypothetical protein U9O78_03020 [Patescibacteria group bacterium]|nr:hypothetical protein [Patescibacteria group bacterium]